MLSFWHMKGTVWPPGPGSSHHLLPMGQAFSDCLPAPAAPPQSPQSQRAPSAEACLPVWTELINMLQTSSHWDRALWALTSFGLAFYLY